MLVKELASMRNVSPTLDEGWYFSRAAQQIFPRKLFTYHVCHWTSLLLWQLRTVRRAKRKLIFNNMIWFFDCEKVDIFVTLADRTGTRYWVHSFLACFGVNCWDVSRLFFDTLYPCIEPHSLRKWLVWTDTRSCCAIWGIWLLLEAWHQHALLKCLQWVSIRINILNRVLPACWSSSCKWIRRTFQHKILVTSLRYARSLCNCMNTFRVMTVTVNLFLQELFWVLFKNTILM